MCRDGDDDDDDHEGCDDDCSDDNDDDCSDDDEDDEMFFLVRSGGFPLTCEGRWSDHIWKHTTVALNTLKHRNTRISEEQ